MVSNKRRLYRINPTAFLNDVKLFNRNFGKFQLHYGEIPKLDFLNLTNFEDVWNNKVFSCSSEMTIFKNKYILGYLNSFKTMRVSKKILNHIQ